MSNRLVFVFLLCAMGSLILTIIGFPFAWYLWGVAVIGEYFALNVGAVEA